MPDPSFVHLRVHTEFTVTDSIIRVAPLIKKVAADGQVAVAARSVCADGGGRGLGRTLGHGGALIGRF